MTGDVVGTGSGLCGESSELRRGSELGGGDLSLDRTGQCGVVPPGAGSLDFEGCGSLLDGSVPNIRFGITGEHKARWIDAAEWLDIPMPVLLAGRLGLVL